MPTMLKQARPINLVAVEEPVVAAMAMVVGAWFVVG